MGRQYNKVEKRRRRKAYIQRRKEAIHKKITKARKSKKSK